MTCDLFGTGEGREQIWIVKVMEIRPGGSKLGPLALRSNLKRGQTYYNTARFPSLFSCHIRDEAAVIIHHSKSRVCATGEKKK